MKENVKYTDVYKKEVKCLVRTDVIPWENCGIIGTNPYKEAITDLEGTALKVGDYVKVIDIRNERSKITTSIIVDIGNRLVPYCYKDYDVNKSIDREHDNLFIYLLIKVGEFPTYRHTVDPGKEEPRFVTMYQSEFDKQAFTYYKTKIKNINKLLKFEISKSHINEAIEAMDNIYDIAQRIIADSSNRRFGEAYNLSYTDIYDFSSTNADYYKAKYEKTLSELVVLQNKYDDLENTNELLKHKIGKMKSHMNTAYGKSCIDEKASTDELLDSANNDIKNNSIIPPNEIVVCRTKEECKWFIEEMKKVNDDDFYKFICAHDHISRITTEYLNSILEDPIITSVLFYFSYDTNPFKVYYYKHDEFEVYEIGSIIEASDLMKQEENKDEN